MENERILYVVMDRQLPGALIYMRDLGINVYAVYNSIEDVRNPVLMETRLNRLVIVETGAGTLTSTKNREELIDIIGMQDENTEVTVFYTDATIKKDAIKILGKTVSSVDWKIYESTLNVVADISRYSESYVLDEYADEEELADGYELRYVGEKYTGEIVEPKENIGVKEFEMLTNKDLESLAGYEVLV